jgi:hypothetical protein
LSRKKLDNRFSAHLQDEKAEEVEVGRSLELLEQVEREECDERILGGLDKIVLNMKKKNRVRSKRKKSSFWSLSGEQTEHTRIDRGCCCLLHHPNDPTIYTKKTFVILLLCFCYFLLYFYGAMPLLPRKALLPPINLGDEEGEFFP